MSYSVPDAIVRAAQSGDEQARRAIYDVFHPPIRVTVARFVGARHPGEIDDVVQDVFAKIFAHLGSFDFARNVKFSTWVYTFARNHCFDVLKRKRKPVVAMSVLAGATDDAGERGALEFAGDEPAPEVVAERREFWGALTGALNRLPTELRRIFRLRELEGLEFRQIARTLHLPLGTVKSKHYRALDRLRLELRGYRFAT